RSALRRTSNRTGSTDDASVRVDMAGIVASARFAAILGELEEPRMTMMDRYGLPVSTSSPLAFAHYQAGLDGLLSYGAGTDDAFAAALAADDGLALAHARRARGARGHRAGARARLRREPARATARRGPGHHALRARRPRARAHRGAPEGIPPRRPPREPGEQHHRVQRPSGSGRGAPGVL